MKIVTIDKHMTISVKRIDLMYISNTKFKKLLCQFDRLNDYNLIDAILIVPKKENTQNSSNSGISLRDGKKKN